MRAFLWGSVCTLFTFWSHGTHLFSSQYLSLPAKETCVCNRKEINLQLYGVLLYNAQDNTTLEQTMVLSLTCALEPDRTGKPLSTFDASFPQDYVLSLQTPFHFYLNQVHESDLLFLLPQGKLHECWPKRQHAGHTGEPVLKTTLTVAVNCKIIFPFTWYLIPGV